MPLAPFPGTQRPLVWLGCGSGHKPSPLSFVEGLIFAIWKGVLFQPLGGQGAERRLTSDFEEERKG